MSLVVLTLAELVARYGGEDALALLASTSATLDVDALAAVSAAIADVSADIEGALVGLGLDYTTVAVELKDIGAVLIKEKLYQSVWSSVPKASAAAADKAREKLKAFAAGQGSATGTTTAQQEAARFSWSNVGDEPATTNPRATARSRMRRLP